MKAYHYIGYVEVVTRRDSWEWDTSEWLAKAKVYVKVSEKDSGILCGEKFDINNPTRCIDSDGNAIQSNCDSDGEYQVFSIDCGIHWLNGQFIEIRLDDITVDIKESIHLTEINAFEVVHPST